MPELPEVETVRRQLRNKIIGKKITGIEVLSEKQADYNENYESKLTHLVFKEIDRIGKLLIFSFENQPDIFLLGHLKMTGQIIVVNSAGQSSGGGHTMSETDLDLPSKHTRIIYELGNDTVMYFNDLRKFGYMKLTTKNELDLVRSTYGPEPIDDDYDCLTFFNLINKSQMPIKPLLLDQTKIAGLGNIYVDEALWRAMISPIRVSKTISLSESNLLCRATTDVLNESILVGGTTFKDFIQTGGENGNYTDYLEVFNRQGYLCSRCSNVIIKTKLRGRGTHYCPKCQT